MKTYKEKVEVKKIVQDVLCNCCGNPAVEEDSGDYHDLHWSCEMKINWRCCGSFPGQQYGNTSYDICQKCFK